ncbi:DUF6542 domain-containing protein [Actinomadura scrupuli]|uniref:DUF6542 domain-containing protein n=1 Tax=Actinomadura scrupuli TaxID=559629 RepID=UPI003D95810D
MPRQPSRSPSPISLTGRGAIVVIFTFGLLGALLAPKVGAGLLAGALFVVGCLLAAVATRRADLLTLAVCPPMVFLAAVVVAQCGYALDDASFLRSAATGLVLTLASGAPWLFLGTALVLAIAFWRGLMGDLRDLRARLAAGAPAPADGDADEDPVRWDT